MAILALTGSLVWLVYAGITPVAKIFNLLLRIISL